MKVCRTEESMHNEEPSGLGKNTKFAHVPTEMPRRYAISSFFYLRIVLPLLVEIKRARAISSRMKINISSSTSRDTKLMTGAAREMCF